MNQRFDSFLLCLFFLKVVKQPFFFLLYKRT